VPRVIDVRLNIPRSGLLPQGGELEQDDGCFILGGVQLRITSA
jgi:hypothetical protein